jgi:hypothetical protein
MGDTKSFMEIEMADIRANIPWLNNPHHGIHIRAVHIDLTAVVMHCRTDLTDGFFKNAMC